MKAFKLKFSFLLLFLVFSNLVYADNEPNNNCSQVEIIEELNNVSSITSHTESGTAHQTTDRYDYYQFTIASDGYIDLSFITDKTYNSIFIGSTCDGAEYYSNTLDDTTKYPPNFSVSNGDTVYIKIERRYATLMSYNLNIDFTISSGNVRDFTKRLINGVTDTNIYGNILMIGNQLLCQNDFNGDTCEEPSATATNNSITQYFADVDSDASTSNSSMMRLDLLPGDNIIWARLYWSARLINPSTTTQTNAQTIKFRTPASSTYTSIQAEVFDNFPLTDGYFDYGASADVTSLVQAGGAGQYFGADIQASTGTNRFASWMLFVVVENPSRPFNNISIYDGFQVVFDADNAYPDSVTATASGFITPRSGSVESNLFIYTGESESGIYDGATITNSSGVPTSLLDAKNQANDLMNGSFSVNNIYRSTYRLSDPTLANPNFQNLIGTDIDKLTVSNLDNQQTSTDITISSTGGSDSDRYSLNAFALETELYVPSFCYDYAYKQQDQYFTEDNDGTQDPRIVGDVIINEDIETTIYIKNLVDSDVVVTDMYVDIFDINTSQATYITNSTKLAKIGDITPVDLVDGTDVTIGSDYINDIDIGTIDSQEYFYVYYSLNPITSNIDIPINVRARYNLTLSGTTVPYTLSLGAQIPMCSTSGFLYTPSDGIFNAAHNDYYNYDVGGINRYYNLPTQVVNREGNFKILSMDDDNLDELEGRTTIVAVEIIDAGAYHYTDASCTEFESSISDRIWVLFDNNATSVPFNQAAIQWAIANGTTSLTNSSDFYANARENTAFRFTYNAMDENGSVPYLEKDSHGDYTILNWRTAWSGEYCVQDMDGNENNNDAVASYCNGTGNNPTTLALCMECLLGKDSRFNCSKDNFALRPEAFMIKIDDQNQTNPASQVRIADNVSGVVTPSAATNHLAAGYDYELEVTAVNHKDNTPVAGYIKTFGALSSDALEYAWAPTVGVGGCNDDSNSSHSFRIVDGAIDLNSSLDQVGEYELQMRDTTWTSVDNNPVFMGHHTGSYFLSSNTPDCILGSNITQAVNYSSGAPTPFIGCNISSNHDSSGSTLKYRNYNLEFHPYKFIMDGIGASFGENNSSIPFIYMNNMSVNENMSFHLSGPVIAAGFNNVATSNFVDNCYAKPVDLTLNKSAISGAVDYIYRFHNTDLPLNDQNGTMNNPAGTFTLETNDFNQSNNGSVNTLLNLNFDREVNTSVNPERLTFSTYDANCSVIADCTMNADLVADKRTQGTKRLDLNVTHLYGRTHASRQRYNTPLNNPANIYFESFCFGTVGGNACDKTLLPNGVTSRRVDDVRWYINDEHNTTNDGSVGIVLQKGGTNVDANDIVDADDNPNGNPSVTQITYDGSRGYPYKTTMQNGASPWLIYNESDPAANRNEFQVEFNNQGDWTGDNVTDTTTDTPTDKATTNRRIMW